MSNIIPFTYNSQQVRTIIKDGEPWFVAKDVCDILEIGNANMAAARLDDDEVSQTEVIDSVGRLQNTNIINESGLYNLILRSDKPQAKPFRKWVTSEVLPSIRKTGSYSVKPVTALEALAQTVKVLQEQEQRVKQLESTTQTIKDTIITQPDNWREDLNRMFNRIVESIGGQRFRELRAESYKLLEERARVDLQRRLVNLRGRLFEQGANKTAIEKTNKLDVIEQDPKLREIYAKIIQEYTIKYVA